MRIMVATDLSEAADVALREGMTIASAQKSILAVVRVLPILPRESLFFPARDELLNARASELVARASATTREHVARIVPPATEVFVDEGIDYAAIVRRADAWHADLLVIGSHGDSKLARVLGDVASRVVRHASCSVLVVRPSDKRGCVVAATDLSDPSLVAVTAGAAEAKRRHAPLHVVHSRSFTEVELFYLIQITPSLSKPASDREPMPKAVGELLAKVAKDATWYSLDGPAGTAIIQHAESAGAQLVVVGTHGATGLERIALGGVAEKVVRACPCSVLVARTIKPGDAS